jgi:aminoglycoside phosphotransferase (APT) family kinase protein
VSRTAVAGAWEHARSVAIDAPEVWIHGDLHARNIIVSAGQLAAVVDWGDLCVGDPATDLAAAWLLFDNRAHADLRDAYGPISADTWERARGWAISFGVLLVDSGTGHDDSWAEVGRRVLERACT